ncbi:MAG: hypothetical protein ACJASQ_003851 [Crocinitomicaceae bacterium]|jgi:hypothetical protein
MKYLIFIALASIVLTSCKKEVETYAVAGVSKVDIIIQNPVQGELISGTETLSIEGRVEANELMSGWSIKITNADNDNIIGEYEELYEQTLYIIHHHWEPNVPSGTNLKIEVQVFDQNKDILAESTIDFICG